MVERFKMISPFIGFCVFYLAVNIIFNFKIWEQVIIREPANAIFIQGESPIYEYAAERVYQNILAGKNLFTPIADVLYPLGWNFALDDVSPIHGIYFLILRPFLSVHQSLMFISLVGIFAANVFMYLLLRFLKIEKKIAFLFALVFGFTPFISLRVGGHQSYTAIYVFPLVGLVFLNLITRKKRMEKILCSILLGIALVITLLVNLYFALMVLLLAMFLGIAHFIWHRIDFYKFITANFLYLLSALSTAGILLIPWFESVSRILVFRQQSDPPSIVDMVTFSSDLLGIFIPSYLNPFYTLLSAWIVKNIPQFGSIFENFIYPGFLILIPYFLFILFYRRLSKSYVFLKPLFWVSLIFWVFTLGPSLHILGRNTSLPLPYLLLSKIPYIQMARAPGRFIIPFIFLGTIVAAFLINIFLKNKTATKKNLFLFFLLFIFFIDQTYLSTPYGIKNIPTKIYNYLSTQERAPILEIPFAIRDGLDYIGDIDSVWSFRGQLLHKQPIFGAYLGRINETTFSYFRNDALLGNLGKLIDGKTTNSAEIVNSLNFKRMIDSADFYGIRYSVIDINKPYSEDAASILRTIGFTPSMTDDGYTLFQRKREDKDFTQIQFGNEADTQFLERGWGKKEESGRWVTGNVAQVLFRISKLRPLKFKFSLKALQASQEMQVYLNRRLVGEASIGTNLRTFSFFADSGLREGINTISLRFAKTYKTNELVGGEKDRRPLAAFFTDINIEEGISPSISEGKVGEITQIDFSDPSNDKYLLQGWSDFEAGARWTEGKLAKTLFYLKNAKPMKLHLLAESIYKPQKVKVYLNDLYTGEVTVATNASNDYFVDASKALKTGINILTFRFSHTAQLAKIEGDPNDMRELSLYIKSLELK